jgi:hypothetical protein
MKTHIFSTPAILTTIAALFGGGALFAATPFDSAKVTRVENKVTLGKIEDGRAADRRPAQVADVVKANNFIQTKGDSRAELQFRDKSLVRVGHNSIFSFEAGSRTLSLEKGEMLFYIVPGKGGATIKTPTLTAAVTGTTVYVKDDELVVWEGTLKIKDQDGNIVTLTAGAGLNAAKFVDGKLVAFHIDIETMRSALSLYKMASFPDNVRQKIADSNPGWAERLVADKGGDGDGGSGGGGGPGNGGSLTSSPVFGGGSAPETTKVN